MPIASTSIAAYLGLVLDIVIRRVFLGDIPLRCGTMDTRPVTFLCYRAAGTGISPPAAPLLRKWRELDGPPYYAERGVVWMRTVKDRGAIEA